MRRKKLLAKWVGILSSLLGVFLLFYVLSPIVKYEISSDRFVSYLSPVPEGESYSSEVVDLTKASNWFVGDEQEVEFSNSGIGYYTISIPKLGIEDATVAIGGEDLADSLIQYPGTALPGKRGSSVVFGHSILPQFYDPRNYLAIFSTLPSMRRGDEIEVGYDGITYLYRVEDMFEVAPTDIQILEQNTSGSYLQLVTCTPPGHPLRPKRLIVRAKIVPFGEVVKKPNEIAWN